MLMRDPYAGHRDYDDFWWQPDPVRDTAWTDVDYALVEAAQLIESFTSRESGQLRWLAEDPDVYWDTAEVVDYAMVEVANHAENYKEGVPHGVTIYPRNPTKDGDFWTIDEWLDYLDNHQPHVERNAPDGGHAPTIDEMEAREAARAERIRKAYEEAE